MDYINQNKAAWEDAFEHRMPGWGDGNHLRLQTERLPFFGPDVAAELETIDWAGKRVAQFCCNNGRELLSLVKHGAAWGTGFDIAENILGQAWDTAQKAGVKNCDFVAGNVLETSLAYDGKFDFLFFTIGALTWFQDLAPLFARAAACLAPGGRLLVNDSHPFMNMVPFPGEDVYAPGAVKLSYSYFKTEPWVETGGMEYMTPSYASKPFTSFSHTTGDIVTAVAESGLRVARLREFGYDVGQTDVYDGMGFPLSYILVADKPGDCG